MTSVDTRGIEAVCWDWNGTLLNDVDIARAAMNTVLAEHRLPVVPDLDAYRRVFGFPVRDFYARVGIVESDFMLAATRYLELFARGISQARLQPGARATLSALGQLGVQQVLISATVEDTLQRQLAPHRLDAHFAQILGIKDAYAPSKAEVAAAWLAGSGHDPRRVLMIGDTNHDEEIAEELGVRFIRFGRGHQQPPDHGRHPVVHRLHEIIEHVRDHAEP